uniref:P2X purinoreceptor 7 intracellular domain-containing protein n=1 Tax=Labrus bergylta TaxID=56723 RepID=A0A3Q3GDF4_9LABR
MDDSVGSNGTCATEMSFEVEDFSPPESPVDPHVDHDHRRPDPYRFDLLEGAASAETANDQDSEVQERMGDVSEWYTRPPGGFFWLLHFRQITTVLKFTIAIFHSNIGLAACITAHPGFEPVALNPYVLQAVYGTYMQLYGEMQTPDLNSAYRHLAYCSFVRWCWGYLGHHIRVVIPSCVVTLIWRKFPEPGETYTGF